MVRARQGQGNASDTARLFTKLCFTDEETEAWKGPPPPYFTREWGH